MESIAENKKKNGFAAASKDYLALKSIGAASFKALRCPVTPEPNFRELNEQMEVLLVRFFHFEKVLPFCFCFR